jgi:sugar lactone lactonase YvrE
MRLRDAVLAATFLAALPAAPAAAEYPLPPEHSGARFVSAFDQNQVLVQLPDGTPIGAIVHPDIDGPRGLAFGADGRLYLGCENSSRVLVFDALGNYLSQFTHATLAGATGLAFAPDGNLWVGSFANDSIVVFTPDGAHVRTVSPPELDGPNCAQFDRHGFVYVASALNDSVLVLDASDQWVATITDPELDSPMAVAFDASGESLLVSGGLSDKIVVFDRATRLKTGVLSDADLPTPQGVAIDDRGFVHASSFVSGKIVVFDPATGGVVRRDTYASAPILRSIAFEPVPAHVAARRGNVNATLGEPLRVLRVNGSSGDRYFRTSVPVGGPLDIEIASYPAAPPTGIASVGYVRIGENGPPHLTPLPQGTGTAVFSIPPSGGSPIVLVNTLGFENVLGAPRVSGTPLGPGVVFHAPRVPPRHSGLVFTTFFVVLDANAPNGRAALTNALVVTVQ